MRVVAPLRDSGLKFLFSGDSSATQKSASPTASLSDHVAVLSVEPEKFASFKGLLVKFDGLGAVAD
jgi:hypothetical protein